MSDIRKLQANLIHFRDQRNWKQFHNPKDVAISLSLEAAEVLEHFQWKTPEEIDAHLAAYKTELSHELADVLHWVLLMAHDLDIDVVKACEEKLAKNEAKYPVDKSRDNHKKYTELA